MITDIIMFAFLLIFVYLYLFYIYVQEVDNVDFATVLNFDAVKWYHNENWLYTEILALVWFTIEFWNSILNSIIWWKLYKIYSQT